MPKCVCVCVCVCVLHYFYIWQLTLSLLAVTQYHLVTVSLTAWSGVRCLTTVVPYGVVSLSSTVSPTHDKPLVTIEIYGDISSVALSYIQIYVQNLNL